VHPDPVALLDGRALPERQVRPPQGLEERQQLVGILDRPMQPIDPQILVVADDLRLVVGQDPAIAAGTDHLGVHDVGDALQHRPLALPRAGPRAVACLG
jgi:hypothetical protein